MPCEPPFCIFRFDYTDLTRWLEFVLRIPFSGMSLDITLSDYCVPLAAHLVFTLGGNEASANDNQ